MRRPVLEDHANTVLLSTDNSGSVAVPIGIRRHDLGTAPENVLVIRIEDWQAVRVERSRRRLRRPRFIRRLEVVREPAPAARWLRAAREVQERDCALAVLLDAGLF